MKFLLDTSVFIWWIESKKPTISQDAWDIIQNPDHEIFVSTASIWEISIKKSLGKIRMKQNTLHEIKKNQFSNLAIEPHHAMATEKLPFHHKDPFDRILIAQCLEENLTFISRDQMIKKYRIHYLEA